MIPFDRERLHRLMRTHNVSVILATTRQNVRYLTGGYYLPFYARTPRFGGSQYLPIVAIPAENLDSAFYVGRKDSILNELDYIEVFGPLWISNRHWIPRSPSMSAAAAEKAVQVLRSQGLTGGTIGIECSFLPADAFETLRSGLSEAAFVNATPLLAELRAVKRPAEVEQLRQVHHLTAEAVRAVLTEGRPEQTTLQIATSVQRRIEERGASFLYAFTNVGPGLLRAPSGERWGRRRPLHVDAGAEFNEYEADIARMGSIGAPPSLALDLFTACLDAQDQIRGAVRAGLPCRDLWRIGTETMTRGRWGQYGRFLAHGLGMVNHEPPEVSERSHGSLEASMVLSVETEYLHPEAGHIKIEDTIVVTPTGCEGLGDVDREWCVVPDVDRRA